MGRNNHLVQLGCGILYLSSFVEELLVVVAGLFIVFEDVGVCVGDIEIGGDGAWIIRQVFLPGFHSLRIMLSQVIAFALGECDRFHDGCIRAQEFLGEIQIVQPLRIPFGIDADHTKTIGTARMLHAADEEGELEILIGSLKVFYL